MFHLLNGEHSELNSVQNMLTAGLWGAAGEGELLPVLRGRG